ncbi:MAG: Hsp20/alpha crystallin family protein [Vicinamibacterales bacterium]
MYVVRKGGNRNIERIQHEMEDVFHALMTSGRPIRVRIASGVPAWRPPVEVYETDDALVVLVELAGMADDQIEVVLDDSVMTIRGERPAESCDERRTVHAMNILYGPFAAEVYLPFSVDHERVEASYEAGMLRVRLPRAMATRVAIGSESRLGDARS